MLNVLWIYHNGFARISSTKGWKRFMIWLLAFHILSFSHNFLKPNFFKYLSNFFMSRFPSIGSLRATWGLSNISKLRSPPGCPQEAREGNRSIWRKLALKSKPIGVLVASDVVISVKSLLYWDNVFAFEKTTSTTFAEKISSKIRIQIQFQKDFDLQCVVCAKTKGQIPRPNASKHTQNSTFFLIMK